MVIQNLRDLRECDLRECAEDFKLIRSSENTKVSQNSSRDKAKQVIIQLKSHVTLLFLYLDIICVVIC